MLSCMEHGKAHRKALKTGVMVSTHHYVRTAASSTYILLPLYSLQYVYRRNEQKVRPRLTWFFKLYILKYTVHHAVHLHCVMTSQLVPHMLMSFFVLPFAMLLAIVYALCSVHYDAMWACINMHAEILLSSSLTLTDRKKIERKNQSPAEKKKALLYAFQLVSLFFFFLVVSIACRKAGMAYTTIGITSFHVSYMHV